MEYKFILYPFLQLATILFLSPIRKARKDYLFFFIITLISLVIYVLYSYYVKNIIGVSISRTEINLHLGLILKTLVKLITKADLFLGLWNGITIHHSMWWLSWKNIDFHSIYSFYTINVYTVTVFILVFLIYSCLFTLCDVESKNGLITIIAVFLVIMLAPPFVLSISSLYQNLVENNYIQGHLVSFYIQIGTVGIGFSLSLFLIENLKKIYIKRVCVIIVSILFTINTLNNFIYNKINGDIMTYNSSKWKAMDLLNDFSKNHTSEKFCNKNLYDFSGVSNIPSMSNYNGKYWNLYSKWVLTNPSLIDNKCHFNNFDIINYVNGRFFVFIRGRRLDDSGTYLLSRNPERVSIGNNFFR